MMRDDDRQEHERDREQVPRNEVAGSPRESDPRPAMGGVGGAAVGAAAGSLAGPVGVGIGALAGAIGGWWAGRAIHHAANDYEREDPWFREYHSSLGTDQPEYEDARPAYLLGYVAGRNPEYRDKDFEDVEEHVRLGWTPDIIQTHGEWTLVRPYAERAFLVGRQRDDGWYEREVPVSDSGRAVDLDLGDEGNDPGAIVAESAENGEAVYPTEIDALANGIAAEPDSAAAREFGVREADEAT
jgi:hypothetical protein